MNADTEAPGSVAGDLRAGPPGDADRYRLGRLSGAGSEGLLYRGSLTTDSGVVLDVAIKMLHPRFAHRIEALGRRWAEQVELFRSLRAAGMVAVRDVFAGPLPHPAGQAETDGIQTLFLVMNWVDGIALDEWAAHHVHKSPAERLKLLLPVAAALDLAHSGAATGGVPVVHCDVKPANILVTAGGDTVLVDVGLTRTLPGGSRDSAVTGTAGYLAPEVIADGHYSAASDGYALGMVAWQLLTGTEPPGEYDPQRLHAELTAAHPEQPALVSHVIAMLDARPEQRPALLANWCAQLRNSSLPSSDADGLAPFALQAPVPRKDPWGGLGHEALGNGDLTVPPASATQRAETLMGPGGTIRTPTRGTGRSARRTGVRRVAVLASRTASLIAIVVVTVLLVSLPAKPPHVANNTRKLTVGTPIPVGTTPEGIAITPDGKSAYVANYISNTVTPITLATGMARSPIAVGNGPNAIAITPDGTRAYVANFNDNTVTPISLSTDKLGAPIAVGQQPSAIAISFDGATAYVADFGDKTVTPISLATDAAGTRINFGNDPQAIAISPDRSTAYLVNLKDKTVTPFTLATGTPGNPIPVGRSPVAIAITPNGYMAYIANAADDTVTPISLATGAPGKTISVGKGPAAIAITPNGATAYVANGGDNTVTPISLASGIPGTPISVGKGPAAIAITPNGATAYVVNGDDNTVTPISLGIGS